jgi:hypothetical protein
MTEEELKRMLSNTEDGWTERKTQSVGKDDVRKTLIGFANSVPDGGGSASSVRPPWIERSGSRPTTSDGIVAFDRSVTRQTNLLE